MDKIYEIYVLPKSLVVNGNTCTVEQLTNMICEHGVNEQYDIIKQIAYLISDHPLDMDTVSSLIELTGKRTIITRYIPPPQQESLFDHIYTTHTTYRSVWNWIDLHREKYIYIKAYRNFNSPRIID